MDEAMGLGFSLFNNHINDADRKARAYLAYYIPAWSKRVEERISEHGVMSITETDADQEPALVFYVGMVCALVNEGKTIPERKEGDG